MPAIAPAARPPRAALLAGLVLLVASCGYHFEGTGNALPGNVQTVVVPIFRNDSDLEGIEADFTAALIEEFAKGRKIRVVDDERDAQGRVRGRIVSLRNRAVSFTADDRVEEVEMEVRLSVFLERIEDGKAIWKDSRIKVREDFAVQADSVTTGSAEFLGRSSDSNEVDTIEVADVEQREAVDRAAREFARTVYRRMLDDF